MGSNFSFDQQALRKAVEDAANDELRKMGRRIQALMDAVSASHANQPVEQVRAALSTAATNAGLELNTEQLQAYAQEISERRQIKVEVEKLRW